MQSFIKRILFATDFSESSTQAFQYARAWAEVCGAHLDLLHVIGVHTGLDMDASIAKLYFDEREKLAQDNLKELEEEAGRTVSSVKTRLMVGFPSEQISLCALDEQSDLIVTGTHGWRGLDRFFMGSIAERVICEAPCPVLSIRGDKKGEGEDDKTHVLRSKRARNALVPRHLLLPLEFSTCSLEACEYVKQVAKEFTASVTLLHAVEPPSYSLEFNPSHPLQDQQFRNKIESRLSELTDRLKEEGITGDFLLRDQGAAEAILEVESENPVDLIVMGTHARKGFSRIMLGSVAAVVLRKSSCPVLTVKPLDQRSNR